MNKLKSGVQKDPTSISREEPWNSFLFYLDNISYKNLTTAEIIVLSGGLERALEGLDQEIMRRLYEGGNQT